MASAQIALKCGLSFQVQNARIGCLHSGVDEPIQLTNDIAEVCEVLDHKCFFPK